MRQAKSGESSWLKSQPDKVSRPSEPSFASVSHEFDMDDWKPDNRRMVRNVELYYQPNIPSEKDTDYYYWVVPASVAGAWLHRQERKTLPYV